MVWVCVRVCGGVSGEMWGCMGVSGVSGVSGVCVWCECEWCEWCEWGAGLGPHCYHGI